MWPKMKFRRTCWMATGRRCSTSRTHYNQVLRLGNPWAGGGGARRGHRVVVGTVPTKHSGSASNVDILLFIRILHVQIYESQHTSAKTHEHTHTPENMLQTVGEWGVVWVGVGVAGGGLASILTATCLLSRVLITQFQAVANQGFYFLVQWTVTWLAATWVSGAQFCRPSLHVALFTPMLSPSGADYPLTRSGLPSLPRAVGCGLSPGASARGLSSSGRWPSNRLPSGASEGFREAAGLPLASSPRQSCVAGSCPSVERWEGRRVVPPCSPGPRARRL